MCKKCGKMNWIQLPVPIAPDINPSVISCLQTFMTAEDKVMLMCFYVHEYIRVAAN